MVLLPDGADRIASNSMDDLDLDYSSMGRAAPTAWQEGSTPSRHGDDDGSVAMLQHRRRSSGEASSSSSSTLATRTSSSRPPSHRVPPRGTARDSNQKDSEWKHNKQPVSTSRRAMCRPSSFGSVSEAESRALTRRITNCSRTADLHRLWSEQQANFNRFHVAAMFTSLAKVSRLMHITDERHIYAPVVQPLIDPFPVVSLSCRPSMPCTLLMLPRCAPCCRTSTRPLSPS